MIDDDDGQTRTCIRLGKVFAISHAPKEPQPLRYRLGPLCCTMSSVPLNINDGERGRLGHGHCIVYLHHGPSGWPNLPHFYRKH